MIKFYFKKIYFLKLLNKIQKNGVKLKYYNIFYNIFFLYSNIVKYLKINYLKISFKLLNFEINNNIFVYNNNLSKKKSLIFFFKLFYILINKQLFRKLKNRLIYMINELTLFYNTNMFINLKKKIYIKKKKLYKKKHTKNNINNYLGIIDFKC